MLHLREAHDGDSDVVVDIFQAARAAAMAYLPVVHTDAEDRVFFRGLADSGAMTVALEGERVVGFVVVDRSRVEHLYVAPDAWRRGAGSRLLDDVRSRHPDGLELWVFQRNHAAIAFYTARGFRIVERTDGADNEEREPDAMMVWRGAR